MVETDYLSEIQLAEVLDVNKESKLCRTSVFFCRLESHYLGCDIAPQVCLNDLFQPSSHIKLYHKERPLPSCGVLDSNKSSQVCFGWLTEVNIDSLFMPLCVISDVRRINGLKNLQFTGLEVRLLVNCPFFFVSAHKSVNLISRIVFLVTYGRVAFIS